MDVLWHFYVFFFQAEDGIRDKLVTGVQTCALPISCRATRRTARTTTMPGTWSAPGGRRSEEHTSELQSLAYLVCRLLLEKKKNKKKQTTTYQTNIEQVKNVYNLYISYSLYIIISCS